MDCRLLQCTRRQRILLFSIVSVFILLIYSSSTVTFRGVQEMKACFHYMLQKPRPPATAPETSTKSLSGNDVTLKQCSAEHVLCGIDTERSTAEYLKNTQSETSLRRQFLRLTTPEKNNVCSADKRFGRVKRDGGYHVCVSSPFGPIPASCLVYSFGINKDWSFDEAMAEHGCEVHSFDPSIGLKDHMHKPLVNFHNLGLWGSDIVNDKNWTLNKLSTIRSKLGHQQRIIDVIKVDAEAAEWPFLRNVLNEDLEQLNTVRQLVMEIHSPRRRPSKLSKEDVMEMVYYASALKARGFTVFRLRQQYTCCGHYSAMMPKGVRERCCQETSFVQQKAITV